MICPQCQKDFEVRREHQKFCSNHCRTQFHAGTDGGLRGAVASVRKLKGGMTSVVIRFRPIEAGNALRLEPGAIVELVS